MPTSSPRAILFDLDNTLVDRDAAFASWLDGLTQPGLGGTPLPSLALEEVLQRDASGFGDRQAFCSWLHGRWPWLGEDPAAVFGRLTAGIHSQLRPDSAVKAMLDELSCDYRLAVVSNGGSFNQRSKLARAGLSRHFDSVIISGEVGCEKPDAAIFQLALQRLGVAPHEAVFVGDQPLIDIAGAAAAGLLTCWLRQGCWPEGLPSADGEVECVGDLPSWLARRWAGAGALV